jgi:copper chaperone
MANELVFTVSGMSCAHCKAAITEEVSALPGVEAVDVDLDAKRVTVRGATVRDDEVRAAIADAGYEAA